MPIILRLEYPPSGAPHKGKGKGKGKMPMLVPVPMPVINLPPARSESAADYSLKVDDYRCTPPD